MTELPEIFDSRGRYLEPDVSVIKTLTPLQCELLEQVCQTFGDDLPAAEQALLDARNAVTETINAIVARENLIKEKWPDNPVTRSAKQVQLVKDSFRIKDRERG
jgi:hypothetical protein